jgi:hypothetical protein
MRELDDYTGAIVDASLRMHRDLGPGLRQVGLLINVGGFPSSAPSRLRVNQVVVDRASGEGRNPRTRSRSPSL